MPNKKCTRCGKEKPTTAKYFNKRVTKPVVKFRAQCKDCEELVRIARLPTRFCEKCGKQITKHGKRFCSTACANSVINLTRNINRRVVKPCLVCGNKVANSSKNSFCSLSCASQSKVVTNREKYISEWLLGNNSGNVGKNEISLSRHVRNYLLEKSGYKCPKCSWKDINPATGKVPLQINHIDGNYLNSSPENLEVLCPNCHSITLKVEHTEIRSINLGKNSDWH